MLKFIAKVLMLVFALPALGLLTFEGGLLSGVGVSLLIALVGTVAMLFLLPALLTIGLGAVIGAGVLGGSVGARLMQFAIGTGIYTLTLYLVSTMVSSLVLIGFWPTVGAAALLGLVGSLLNSSQE